MLTRSYTEEIADIEEKKWGTVAKWAINESTSYFEIVFQVYRNVLFVKFNLCQNHFNKKYGRIV